MTVPQAVAGVELAGVDGDSLGRVRSLNAVLFPVRYTPAFYKSLLKPGQFARLAFYNGACVGTVTCRKQPLGFADAPTAHLDPSAPPAVDYEVYMMTLGVLAPYRRLGIAHGLLASAIEAAAADPTVRRIVLHVQTDNDDALRFYHRRGFTTLRMVERYYKVLDPPHAYLLQYRLR
ncbi:N-acetyltransferase 5 [Coemansia spiralis]|nr:N-acetyltransferase 5 [Coemansia spiralis]